MMVMTIPAWLLPPPTPLLTRALTGSRLALTPGLGPTRIKKLIEQYGTADRVFQASLTELEATGMRAVSAQSMATGKSLELAQQECEKAVEAGAKVISLSDPEYPSRLKEIYDPPVVLFVKGSVEVLAQPGIAMVGTRHPTPYGSGMAERLSTDLAARGLVIISGLARGIDTASHRGAVAAKGKTVAVLGTGIDVMYPKENTRLAEQIVGPRRRADLRVPSRNLPRATKFSHSQSDHQRHVGGRAGGGSCGIQRHAHHVAPTPSNKTATFTPFRAT